MLPNLYTSNKITVLLLASTYLYAFLLIFAGALKLNKLVCKLYLTETFIKQSVKPIAPGVPHKDCTGVVETPLNWTKQQQPIA